MSCVFIHQNTDNTPTLKTHLVTNLVTVLYFASLASHIFQFCDRKVMFANIEYGTYVIVCYSGIWNVDFFLNSCLKHSCLWEGKSQVFRI